MDEEEELDNTLIGQEEEAPGINTEDVIIGQPRFLPYADDVVPSRVNALSVFTTGGDLKSGIDVNAITPALTTLPASSDVNTALNQEVAVGSPENNEPSFMSRLGSFFYPPGGGAGGLPPTFTPPSEGATQATAGTDITPVTLESLGLESPQQRIFKEALERGETSSNINPFTGETIEKPTPLDSDVSSSSGMTIDQSAIMNALSNQNQAMDMNQQAISNAQIEGATQGQETAQGQATTTPASGLTTVGGASLSEFLSGQAMPERGFVREERRLGGRGVTLTPEQMDDLSAERKARLDARLPGDQSVSDRERRAARGDGISMADRTAMAKANARGATPREVAYGNQVAAELGVDIKTGLPLQTTSGLTETERLNREKFLYDQQQDILAAEEKAKETEGERSVNRAKALGSLQALKADLDLIKETGEEVKTLTLKPRTEGLLAKALATLSPTSTAAQLERASGVLTGDAFIKGMRIIKEFGGGLGSVTEVEGLKVERAQGAIFENGMSDEERRKAVQDYIQVRENAYNRIREAFVKEYGEADAQTYLGTQNANVTTGKAIPNDRNVASAADALLSDPKYN